MIGKYDQIQQPEIIAEGYDYILFTNDIPEQRLGVWQIRNIPYKCDNNTKLARWVKTHPHILLKDYDVSLWHDCNVQVDEPKYFERINELISENVPIASMVHIYRHCIYDEAFEILYLNIDNINHVLHEVRFIKHNGYPSKNGLTETNCILRRHNEKKVRFFCEEWWHMINRFSKRDQLSCNYVAWKCGLEIKYILPSGYSTRNHPYVHCTNHIQKKNIDDVIWYGSLKDRFKKHVQKHYNRFVNSKPYSLEEYYSYLVIIILRKYYSMVSLKYKISTLIKQRNLNK